MVAYVRAVDPEEATDPGVGELYEHIERVTARAASVGGR